MKTLVFILIILEGSEIYDDTLQYGSIDRCNWYAKKLNFYNERQTRYTYSAYCKPLVIEKNEE